LNPLAYDYCKDRAIKKRGPRKRKTEDSEKQKSLSDYA
jgi:hypothetical protein